MPMVWCLKICHIYFTWILTGKIRNYLEWEAYSRRPFAATSLDWRSDLHWLTSSMFVAQLSRSLWDKILYTITSEIIMNDIQKWVNRTVYDMEVLFKGVRFMQNVLDSELHV